MKSVKAYAASSATSPLELTTIPRREPTESDVEIEILFCGICHSDLHTARSEWGPSMYPVVPGHEIIGRVTKVGAKVTKHKVGDLVGVGCLVDSDRTCSYCQQHFENFCPEKVFTYNSKHRRFGDSVTYGGYSQSITVDEHFVLSVPTNLEVSATAPLLCAGITTYAPLRRHGVTKGKTVGIVGLGGLGHMGLKFAKAFGAHVVLFTSSPGKEADAKRLGADEVVISRNAEEMKSRAGTLDFILDTVSAQHEINDYMNLLKPRGTLCMVGAPEHPLPFRAGSVIFGEKIFTGSLIGGIKETQEMLDFCGEHGITADVEVIPIQKVNEAYERMLKSDVKYRFVIDLKSLKD